MSAPKRHYKCCVLECTNEHRIATEDNVVFIFKCEISFSKKMYRKIIGKVPYMFRNQYQHLVRKRQLQTK